MKKFGILFACAYLAATLAAATGARAHTAEQCKKELKTYSLLCKFSPTAWLSGMCKNKKAQAWCSNRKLHDEKFHK